MTQQVQSSLLDRASAWTKDIWEQAATRWTGRTGQDLSYRIHAVNPVLSDIITAECGSETCNLLDLGCGDGILLDDIRFEPVFERGSYLGIDTCPRLIESARGRFHHAHRSFMQMNVTDPGFPEAIRNTGISWNCILAVFVVQEIADAATLFGNLAKIMADDSLSILVTVHPSFADWLRSTGALSVNEALHWEGPEPPLWRWAGEYPIVDEPHDPFPLPHFQRSFEEYRCLLSDAGLHIDRIIEFPEATSMLPKLTADRISPFYAFSSNVYWPGIGEMPSAAALIVRKGTPV